MLQNQVALRPLLADKPGSSSGDLASLHVLRSVDGCAFDGICVALCGAGKGKGKTLCFGDGYRFCGWGLASVHDLESGFPCHTHTCASGNLCGMAAAGRMERAWGCLCGSVDVRCERMLSRSCGGGGGTWERKSAWTRGVRAAPIYGGLEAAFSLPFCLPGLAVLRLARP